MLKSDISRDEFVKFKQDLTACLNPTFIKRLLDLEQVHPNSQTFSGVINLFIISEAGESTKRQLCERASQANSTFNSFAQ